MNNSDLIQYIKRTENMVNPERVAQVNQFSKIMGKLPLKWQKSIAVKGAKSNPYMGFVVEPYSFFLSYEISDIRGASDLLPQGYRIVPTSMFEKTPKRPSVIVGAFNVHTSVFWGSRVELYVIAENIKTGMLSWIIVDYETNTNSFDPGQGFTGATTKRSVITTSFKGDVIVDVESNESDNKIELSANIRNARHNILDQRLWVEGNLSVDYGGDLKDGESEPFGLIFDPAEMESALNVPLEELSLNSNTFAKDYIKAKPFEVACFPFAQHFVTTSVPMGLGIDNAGELERATYRLSRPENMELVS